MSDRNKPIYKLSASIISAISIALHNPGKHWIYPSFDLGEFPVVQSQLGRVTPVVTYSHKVTKTINAVEQTLHLYALEDGTFYLFNPIAQYRKINGSTTKAKEDKQYIVPRNALSVYVIRAFYPADDFTMDNLTLEVTQHTNHPLLDLIDSKVA